MQYYNYSWKEKYYTPFGYVLNGLDLARVDCIKYLRVSITHDLNWKKPIQDTCNKGNRIFRYTLLELVFLLD